jgi:hypothetical protein
MQIEREAARAAAAPAAIKEFPIEPSLPLSEAAEEVRAWLVAARGGGPFLSAADGHLLIEWLEAGISVSAILLAIELVARRRTDRKSRTPFHLNACSATLKKLIKHQPAPSTRSPLPPPAPLPANIPLREVFLITRTRERLNQLPPMLPEAKARAACLIIREFHEELWELARPEHPELLAKAAEDLVELAEVLGPSGLQRACEERAREQVRRRYSEFSATRVWEELGFGTGS